MQSKRTIRRNLLKLLPKYAKLGMVWHELGEASLPKDLDTFIVDNWSTYKPAIEVCVKDILEQAMQD